MIRKEKRDVWITDDDDEFFDEASAVKRAAILINQQILVSFGVSLRGCTEYELAEIMVKFGYKLVKA